MATLKAFDYNALTESIIEQVMAKNVQHTKPVPIMTYTEFISFLLSVEDKSTPSAIEYWFRCLDIDGDGKISFFELKHLTKGIPVDKAQSLVLTNKSFL